MCSLSLRLGWIVSRLSGAEGLVAASKGVVVQADMELRCLPVMEAVGRLVREGAIGEVLMGKVRLWCDWGRDGKWTPVGDAEGFWLWLGCWYLDVLDVVFGAAPRAAKVTGGRAMNGKMMDYGWANLTYPGGWCGGI